MRYDKPLMIRLSEQEHAFLEELIRREDKIVSKAEMLRRLIHRAHEQHDDGPSRMLREAYWKLGGFMGAASSARQVDKLRQRIKAYLGDVEEADAQ